MGSGDWFIPELSLATQCSQEIDRRRAVTLGHQELQELADRLIVDWYLQRNLIDRCLGRVRHLEVELALANAAPFSRSAACHYEWAREVLDGVKGSAPGAEAAG
jgi:hypothetical protein